jgi:hypothetical protein
MKSTIIKWIGRFLLVDLVFSVGGFLFLALGNNVVDGTPRTPIAKLLYEPVTYGVISLLVLLFLLFVVCLVGQIHWTGKQIDLAFVPVPSPAEISWQIQQETGQAPSIQDVAAVHQMLQSESNQAKINAGIGVASIALVWKTLHR